MGGDNQGKSLRNDKDFKLYQRTALINTGSSTGRFLPVEFVRLSTAHHLGIFVVFFCGFLINFCLFGNLIFSPWGHQISQWSSHKKAKYAMKHHYYNFLYSHKVDKKRTFFTKANSNQIKLQFEQRSATGPLNLRINQQHVGLRMWSDSNFYKEFAIERYFGILYRPSKLMGPSAFYIHWTLAVNLYTNTPYRPPYICYSTG